MTDTNEAGKPLKEIAEEQAQAAVGRIDDLTPGQAVGVYAECYVAQLSAMKAALERAEKRIDVLDPKQTSESNGYARALIDACQEIDKEIEALR